MKRALVALFVPAVLIALCFGGLVGFVLPVTLTLTLTVGLPLFYALKAKTAMGWWHCVLGGMLTTAPIALPLLGLALWNDEEMFGAAAFLLGCGVLGGLIFWWLGVYGNPHFPESGNRPAWETLIVLPLLASAWWYVNVVHPPPEVGCVLAVSLSEPGLGSHALARVELADTQVGSVPLSRGDYDDDPQGVCAEVVVRKSWRFQQQGYDYRRLLPGNCGDRCE